MNITINCNISLSKKLRSLFKDGETKVTLICDSVTDGKGSARLVIISEDTILVPNDFVGKETSIMLTPVEIEINQDNEEISVGNIFSATSNGTNEGFVSRLAATNAPTDNKKIATAIKPRQQIEREIPKPFEVTRDPNFKKYISTVEELMIEARMASESKNSNVNLDAISDKRQRAIAIELKEKAEAIDKRAYIVNDKCASLAINDLGISLLLNIPYDLSNISAKRILESKELQSSLRNGLVRIISPNEVSSFHKKIKEVESFGLKTYSNPEEAERAIGQRNVNDDGMAIDIDNDLELGNDLDEPSEQEELATHVGRPVLSGTTTLSGGIRRSTHGSSGSRALNRTNNPTNTNPNLRTIRKK